MTAMTVAAAPPAIKKSMVRDEDRSVPEKNRNGISKKMTAKYMLV